MIWLLAITANAVDAEGERVRDELIRYCRESNWKPADIQYERLILEHPGEVDADVHQMGAQAARGLGELMTLVQRLQRIDSSSPLHGDATATLATVEATHGLVMVRGKGVLAPVKMPFAPEARNAIQLAVRSVQERGHFVGLLPIGAYTLDEQAIEVRPGLQWQVFAP